MTLRTVAYGGGSAPRGALVKRESRVERPGVINGYSRGNEPHNILWGSKLFQHHMGVKTLDLWLGRVSEKPSSPVFPVDTRTTLRHVGFRPFVTAGNM